MKKDLFNSSNYDYEIAQELIAQEPLKERPSSRLLVLDRKQQTFSETVFRDIVSLFKAGDVLVINNTKVIKARLLARRESGGRLEVLLLRDRGQGLWEVLVKPGKKARLGNKLFFSEDKSFFATVKDRTEQGGRILQFSHQDLMPLLDRYGKVPTPPYIKKEVDDAAQYQTVYAEKEGSIAAPTAGFHFTPELLETLKAKKVQVVYVTLHCGLPTFRPIKTEDIRDHNMEEEVFALSQETASVINKAKQEKRRVIAVGTTSIRTLESSARPRGDDFKVEPGLGETRLYIYPGYKFKIIDAVVTNFHTPLSTNLVLISTFAGSELVHSAYQYALKEKFRFFSFGDAMFII